MEKLIGQVVLDLFFACRWQNEEVVISLLTQLGCIKLEQERARQRTVPAIPSIDERRKIFDDTIGELWEVPEEICSVFQKVSRGEVQDIRCAKWRDKGVQAYRRDGYPLAGDLRFHFQWCGWGPVWEEEREQYERAREAIYAMAEKALPLDEIARLEGVKSELDSRNAADLARGQFVEGFVAARSWYSDHPRN